MSVWERWLEWYLGVEPAGAGEGMSWSLSLDGLAAGGWTGFIALLTLCAAAVVVMYRLETRQIAGSLKWGLPLLRLLALVVMAVWVGGLTLNVVRTGLPTLVLMFDTSASMGLEDQYADGAREAAAALQETSGSDEALTRLRLAKLLMLQGDGELLRELAQRYRVRLYEFSDSARALNDSVGEPGAEAEDWSAVGELEPTGRATRPGPSLRQVLSELRGVQPSAVVMFSDGVASEDASERLSLAAESGRGRMPPLFPVPLGDRNPARDLELYDLLADPVAFVEQPVTLDFHLKGYGLAGRTARVTLSVTGAAGVVAATEAVLPDDGVAVPLRLSFTPDVEGEYELVLRAEPAEGEVNLENNELRRTIRVRQEQIRVLLAERAPRWEYRHLKAVLERDESVELHTVLQESDLEYLQEDQTALAAFPATKEDLFRYDVVILGDLDLNYMNPGGLELLLEFVRDRGGGLILIAGEAHNPHRYAGTPLEALLPIQLDSLEPAAVSREGFRIEPTRAGRSHPIFQLGPDDATNAQIWSELPPVFWSQEAARRKSGAVVLAVHETRHTADGRLPLIVVQRFGAGQVLYHATDELWQWRRRVEDLFYGRYWSHAVRYLCRARLLGSERGIEFLPDRSTYALGDNVRLRARFVDERRLPAEGTSVTVVAERAGAHQQTLELRPLESVPTVYEGTITQPAAGSWHAWISSPDGEGAPSACDFTVTVPEQELRRREADLADLTRAAELSGGQVVPFQRIDALAGLLPRGQPVPVASAQKVPLWARPEWLVLFVSLLSAEWMLRKRARLV